MTGIADPEALITNYATVIDGDWATDRATLLRFSPLLHHEGHFLRQRRDRRRDPAASQVVDVYFHSLAARIGQEGIDEWTLLIDQIEQAKGNTGRPERPSCSVERNVDDNDRAPSQEDEPGGAESRVNNT